MELTGRSLLIRVQELMENGGKVECLVPECLGPVVAASAVCLEIKTETGIVNFAPDADTQLVDGDFGSGVAWQLVKAGAPFITSGEGPDSNPLTPSRGDGSWTELDSPLPTIESVTVPALPDAGVFIPEVPAIEESQPMQATDEMVAALAQEGSSIEESEASSPAPVDTQHGA